MPRKLKRYLLGIVGFLGAIAFAPTIWNLYWHVPGRLDFLLHRSEYERIVRKIKSLPLPSKDAVWQGGHRSIDGIPVTYNIQEPANQYSIGLTTADWGHFGHAGYIYSDLPRLPVSDDPYSDKNKQQVAPHWWVFSNHLD